MENKKRIKKNRKRLERGNHDKEKEEDDQVLVSRGSNSDLSGDQHSSSSPLTNSTPNDLGNGLEFPEELREEPNNWFTLLLKYFRLV